MSSLIADSITELYNTICLQPGKSSRDVIYRILGSTAKEIMLFS